MVTEYFTCVHFIYVVLITLKIFFIPSDWLMWLLYSEVTVSPDVSFYFEGSLL